MKYFSFSIVKKKFMKTRSKVDKEDLSPPFPTAAATATTDSGGNESPSIKDNWGSFRKLIGDFYYSTRMMVDGDIGIARVFCILRYRLPDHEKPCYQLMYRSSGHNTHKKGSWFPCNGLFSHYETGELYYPKLSNTRFSKEMAERKELLGELKALHIKSLKTDKECVNLLTRFGTLEFMHASWMMGGGFWTDDRVAPIMARHFELPLTNEDRGEIDVTGAIPLTTEATMLNHYTGYALSPNYYKEDQYNIPSHPFIDLRRWNTTPQRIGDESPMTKTLARLGSKLKKDCLQTLYYEDASGNRYLFDIFLNSNLDTMNCDMFVQIKSRATERLVSFLAREAEQEKS